MRACAGSDGACLLPSWFCSLHVDSTTHSTFFLVLFFFLSRTFGFHYSQLGLLCPHLKSPPFGTFSHRVLRFRRDFSWIQWLLLANLLTKDSDNYHSLLTIPAICLFIGVYDTRFVEEENNIYGVKCQSGGLQLHFGIAYL